MRSTGADEGHECGNRPFAHVRVAGCGQGDQAAAPALEVERRGAVHEGDVRAGRALEREPLVSLAARPRQRGTVRLRRVRGGQQARRRLVVVPDRPQPIDRTGQSELGGSQAGHEVTAPCAAGLLHGSEDRVHRRVAAGDALRGDRLSGHDAVPLEKGDGQRVPALGRAALLAHEIGHHRPAPRGPRRPEGHEPAGARRRLRSRARQ